MDTNSARAYSTSDRAEPTPADALHDLQAQLGALQAYFGHFVSAKVDGVLLSIRQLGLWAVLGIVGLIALAGLVVTAIVLVLVGVATAVALLFNAQLWLGQVIVGGGILVLLTLGTIIGMRTWQRRSRQQKVQQYDERQLQQRLAYGHSAADRATADAALQHQ